MNDTATKGGRIYTIHTLDEIQVDTRTRAIAALDEVEARALTTQIQRTSVRLWLLVTEAHDRKAHLALGYETWADYVKAELNMSESRSYQFLDTGHVMKALAAAGVDLDEFGPPPARVVARIKDRLTDVKKAATKAIGEGDDENVVTNVDKAIRALAREPKAPSAAASKAAATKAASSGGAAAATAATKVVPSQRKGEEDLVPCPACAGQGKVTKTVSDRLLALLQKL